MSVFLVNAQKQFLLQVLPLIPITALVIQNSVNMNTLLGYQNRVSTIRRQVIFYENRNVKKDSKSNVCPPGQGCYGNCTFHPEYPRGKS